MMKRRFCCCLCLMLLLSICPPGMPAAAAAETGQPYHKELSAWIEDHDRREYVEMMLDYHVRNNKMVQQALDGGFAAVFLFDGCSDNLDDPVLSDLSYYRVSGICVVLKKDQEGQIKQLYINDNCSTIPDRPLEYGAWRLPEVGEVGPATVCDGTYQIYSVRHKGQYEALHLRTDYYDGTLEAVYMTPEGYASARANEINVHTRTSNHTSGRGMWSAGCPLVGGGRESEFKRLIRAVYYTTYETFELDNFCGTITIDRMPLREELYTLYENPNAVDMFLANSRKIQPEQYLKRCTEEEEPNQGMTMKTALDTKLMTLPCSNLTDARSRTITPIAKGQKVHILDSIKNPQGNVWQKAEFDGEIGYLYQGHTEALTWWERILDSFFG